MAFAGERILPRQVMRTHPKRMSQSVAAIVAVAVGVLMIYFADDWIAGLGIAVLYALWRLLEAEGQPPVIRLALSFQWLQVTCGIYYNAFTGREVEAMYASDYRPMVLIGLGCISVLAIGLYCGLRLGGATHLGKDSFSKVFPFTWRALFTTWVVSIFVEAALRRIAWEVPEITQGILAISYLRLGVTYLVFRRLAIPKMRLTWFLGVLSVELLLGFTGYFAAFREPLILASLALIEAFDGRTLSHWIRLIWVGALMAIVGALWMGIRTSYRASYEDFGASRTARLERIGSLSTQWLESDTIARDVDRLVERVWAIYYPAIAVSRVPEALPHENGAITFAALKHLVTPRIFFPDKKTLSSDSELVRKYTGIYVAGADENTSIAFGYAAEAYVDFGLPMMFLPSLVFGIVMGWIRSFARKLIRHPELSMAVVCVIFWMSLYLFERSWIKTLGLAGTLVIYVGSLVWLFDRFLHVAGSRRRFTGPARSSTAR